MVIAAELHKQLVAHAREDFPNECCGMIASSGGIATRVYRAENAAASPLRYEMDGLEQYRIQSEIEEQGWQLGAIYHSHTRSPPYPSQTDINLAFYPDALYVIIGVAQDRAGAEGTDEAAADVRAYRIVEGRVERARLSVE